MRIEEMPGYEGQDGAVLKATVRQQITRRVRRWVDLGKWAVWHTPEGVQVVPRSELVGRLTAAALPAEARAAARMKVPAGSILVWLESDTEAGLAVWAVNGVAVTEIASPAADDGVSHASPRARRSPDVAPKNGPVSRDTAPFSSLSRRSPTPRRPRPKLHPADVIVHRPGVPRGRTAP